MENLKIKVNSESESKEVQQLFFELGYKKNAKFTKEDFIGFDGWICALYDGSCDYCPTSHTDKEITLPELRDLVVLKRNDAGDANYKTNCGTQCYITGEDVYAFQDNKWFLSEMQHKDILDMIKPIEKPMKEYLRKNNDGEYILEVTDEREAQEPHAKHWIEIPECSNIAVIEDSKVKFYSEYTSADLDHLGKHLIWMRHTHPEELPFIDDEPSLNDQYAEIEKVRQSHRTASETSNPTIKETLNQRQSQYGSFEDVAMITEQMVDVMRKGYYENLAYNQKMALYMICSKMARIVNGDPNHKDSWHDIAGYATLIDNELVSEKDMPF